MRSDHTRFIGMPNFRARLAARAAGDEDFRRELMAAPRAVLERELSEMTRTEVHLPAELHIHVHEESARNLHLVLPEKIVESEEDNDMLIFWQRILRPAP